MGCKARRAECTLKYMSTQRPQQTAVKGKMKNALNHTDQRVIFGMTANPEPQQIPL